MLTWWLPGCKTNKGWSICIVYANYCCLLIIKSNSMDPYQAQQNVEPDLDPSCEIF